MSLVESFKENWYLLLLPGMLIALLSGVYIITGNTHQELQKIVDSEETELNQVKGDCKALGNWIIKHGPNQLNLDPVIDEANNLYMVDCK